jgi:hypothetical protein
MRVKGKGREVCLLGFGGLEHGFEFEPLPVHLTPTHATPRSKTHGDFFKKNS